MDESVPRRRVPRFLWWAIALPALVASLHVAVLMFEQLFRNDIEAVPLRAQVEPGGTLVFGGRWLLGSRVYIRDAQQAGSPWSQAPMTSAPSSEASRNYFANALPGLRPGNVQIVAIRVPEEYDGRKIAIMVQRAGLLPYLRPLLPLYQCRPHVQVGKPPVAQEPPKEAFAMVSPVVARGETFGISGSGLGESGEVLVGGLKASVKGWSPSRIEAVPPADLPLGETMTVTVVPEGKNAIEAGMIAVVAAAPKPPAAAPSGGGRGAPAGPTATLAQAYRSLLSGSMGDDRGIPAPISQALAAGPNDPLALGLKAYSLLLQQRPGEARPLVARALLLTNGQKGRARAVSLATAGWLSETSGDMTSAERQYQSAVEADRTCVLAHLSRALFLADNSRLTEAAATMREALRANPVEARGSSKFMQLAAKLGVR